MIDRLIEVASFFTKKHELTNSSFGIKKEIDIKLLYGIKRIDAITLSNLDINKKETRVINFLL